MRREPVLIEGYASVFGRADLSGDVVRAGAFAKSLGRRLDVPLLVGHRESVRAGRWVPDPAGRGDLRECDTAGDLERGGPDAGGRLSGLARRGGPAELWRHTVGCERGGGHP